MKTTYRLILIALPMATAAAAFSIFSPEPVAEAEDAPQAQVAPQAKVAREPVAALPPPAAPDPLFMPPPIAIANIVPHTEIASADRAAAAATLFSTAVPRQAAPQPPLPRTRDVPEAGLPSPEEVAEIEERMMRDALAALETESLEPDDAEPEEQEPLGDLAYAFEEEDQGSALFSREDIGVIREAVLVRNVRPVTLVPFPPVVGERVPDPVYIHPMPAALRYAREDLAPYSFVVIDGKVVVIEPDDRSILAVFPL